ncbi:MAG TPA: hypothetical protein VL485_12100 [Ktedonobacteraceae bacterium]|nr:hypothetical protein [Ktedonobacteraceae bacterium]
MGSWKGKVVGGGRVGWYKTHPLPVIEGKRVGGETPRDTIAPLGFPLQVGDAFYTIPRDPIDPRGYPLTHIMASEPFFC